MSSERNWQELEKYGIYDLSDVLTSEELEHMQIEKEQEYLNAPDSMDSLGLSWRDFY